jgi:hypothetical protein
MGNQGLRLGAMGHRFRFGEALKYTRIDKHRA